MIVLRSGLYEWDIYYRLWSSFYSYDGRKAGTEIKKYATDTFTITIDYKTDEQIDITLNSKLN